jgi:hypothetical protein
VKFWHFWPNIAHARCTHSEVAAELYPLMALFFWRTIGLRISPYQKLARIFTTKRFVRADSCGTCFDINGFHLLSPAILSLWYSRFEVTWLLKDDSNSKTCVRFIYVLPEVLHSVFFIWNKIFIQPRGKYFTYINQKCYFLL